MKRNIDPVIKDIIDTTVTEVINSLISSNITPQKARSMFISSNTYKLLINPETGYWQESTQFILYEFKREIKSNPPKRVSVVNKTGRMYHPVASSTFSVAKDVVNKIVCPKYATVAASTLISKTAKIVEKK